MTGRTAWFPGHMAKGSRALADLVGKLDVLVEVRDARAPELTASPMAERLGEMKPLWLVLSKADLADRNVTDQWIRYYREKGIKVWALDLRAGRLEPLRRAIGSARPRYRELRLAVFGIPNVGKSALLNSLVGKKAALVGGMPGVTRGVSWYKGPECLVVDSPGILNPKADSAAERALCWLGCSKADVIGGWDGVALDLLKFLRRRKLWTVIEERWNVAQAEDSTADLENLARRLGCLQSGGRVDFELAGRRLLDAFSTGRVGRFSLEKPGEPAANLLEPLP